MDAVAQFRSFNRARLILMAAAPESFCNPTHCGKLRCQLFFRSNPAQPPPNARARERNAVFAEAWRFARGLPIIGQSEGHGSCNEILSLFTLLQEKAMPAGPDLLHAPIGATLVPGGATFRIWAPRAKNVYVSGDFNNWKQDTAATLQDIGGGHWAAFVPGLKERDQYLFYIDGVGSQGYKRDPRARKLTHQPAFPFSNCIFRDPSSFQWHNTGFTAPAFNDLIIYQLHVGVFHSLPTNDHGKFLDIVDQLPYLAGLGINAIQPLPIVEWTTSFSLGYNGTDYFSPENDYGEFDPAVLQTYFETANRLLRSRGLAEYSSPDVLQGSDNQLRAMIDLCHVFGIAVLFDVVYNHAGGGFDANSMWFLDRMPEDNANDSLYFTDQTWAGGQVFAYWNNDVKQFIIDNARFFYEEYRVDGYASTRSA